MRRFCTAFAFAILLWVLISALIQSLLVVTKYSSQLVSIVSDSRIFIDIHCVPFQDEWPSDEDFLIPPDLERVRCVWGDEIGQDTKLKASFKQILQAPLTFPFKVQEKFELPIDSENLFFLSRGVYSGGRIKIKRSRKASDVAKVKVRLEYLRPGTPRIAKVCQFKRGDGETGLGVFTPEIPKYPQHNLAVYITVGLPKSNSSDYLHIKKFETDMPNFTQLLGELGKDVFFDEISLKSANGGIVAKSIVAQQGRVETSNGPVALNDATFGSFDVISRNGPISGVFNATGSLILKTSNDRIAGKVYIDTEILLNHFQKGSTGGDFDVTASNVNGLVKLRITDAPVDSKLDLQARSKNAPVDVMLHPTFEGDFEVSSNFLLPTVHVKQGVRDPSGQDRDRSVQLSRQGHLAKGNVSWSDEGKGRGHVELETSYSPAVLKL
ncbi:hypothetical protein M378DRAFT_78834 [Amanita muscaria Koide BX008]|uniref:Uncharacterized protein n=1 Tax=Amanita muscaria (strain Koide BX008) TaxID=946122 RepID=A0A0C2WQS7_AMAMK|nr:hypothetical protein M378DRAFT_78834 [Amanita muscaria Koide BX008]